MRAAVVSHQPSDPALVVREVPDPHPGPGWVRVVLRAASLNRLDRMTIDDRTALGRPSVLGSDGAGVIDEVGEGVSADFLGREVIILPSLSWGTDPRFPSDAFEILGAPTDGTHAELVTVPVENVFDKPQRLTWLQAAALPMAGLTAWRALVTRGGLVSGERAVIGAASSGVGTSAIQIATALGARVVAITSRERAGQALRLGAETEVLRSHRDLGRRITDVAGPADLALDPTGALWQPMAQALRPAGRLVVVGKMATDTGSLNVQTLYWKQLDVRGSSMGSPDDFWALLSHLEHTTWTPAIDSSFSLEEMASAYERLDAPDRVGKVVVDLGPRVT